MGGEKGKGNWAGTFQTELILFQFVCIKDNLRQGNTLLYGGVMEVSYYVNRDYIQRHLAAIFRELLPTNDIKAQFYLYLSA
jgi:hypothetical protein